MSRGITERSRAATQAQEVFITEELANRPAKRTDCQREKTAILDLARRLADTSSEVLPRFVELAMERCDPIIEPLRVSDEDGGVCIKRSWPSVSFGRS